MTAIEVAAAVIPAALSLVGVALAAVLGHRAGAKLGRAAIQDAETNAREAATADWDAYTRGLNTWAHSLIERLGKVEGRLADSEARATKAEDRAVRAETLYRTAVGYLRQLVKWCIEQHGHEQPMPAVPSELAGDL